MARVVWPDGLVEWRDRVGDLHRVDGPAVEGADGCVEWWRHGLLHRDGGGPAVIRPLGVADELDLPVEEWWQNGVRHRVGGPAVVWPDGCVAWWEHGVLVRVGGGCLVSGVLVPC